VSTEAGVERRSGAVAENVDIDRCFMTLYAPVCRALVRD
jgi:hypothetical protein